MPPPAVPAVPAYTLAPEAPRLAPQLVRVLLQLAGRTAREHSRAVACLGLTCARLRVLEVVERCPGSSITGVAQRLDLTRQAVHRVVHDLMRLDCLETTRRTAHSRAPLPLWLTDEGDLLLECARENHDAPGLNLDAVFVPADLRYALAILERAAQRLNPPSRAGGP